MTSKELISIATIAFGKQWRKPLCDAIGISREMLYRYERGAWPIPDAKAELVYNAVRKRAAELNALLIRINSKRAA